MEGLTNIESTLSPENNTMDNLISKAKFLGDRAVAFGVADKVSISGFSGDGNMKSRNPDIPNCIVRASLDFSENGYDHHIPIFMGRGETPNEANNDLLANLRDELKLTNRPISIDEAIVKKGQLLDAFHFSNPVTREIYKSQEEYIDVYKSRLNEINGVMCEFTTLGDLPILRAIEIAAEDSNTRVVERRINKSHRSGHSDIIVLSSNNTAFANAFPKALVSAIGEVMGTETIGETKKNVGYTDISQGVAVIMEGFRHGPEDIEEMDESKVEKFDASEVNDFMDEYIIPTIEHIYDGSYRMARDLAGKERLNAIYSIMMQYDPFFKGHEQYAGTPINIGKTALIEHIRNGINMFEGNITDYDYIVLEKAIDNTTDETGPEWKITDPDCGQRGRQIGETMYEFEEVLKDGSTTRLQIDLTDYSTQEMESICRDYGTELIFVRKEYEDPWFQVAEWAFENELAENGDVR